MDDLKSTLHQAKYKSDPRVAIDIAYRVATKYHEAGCPKVFDSAQDNWYAKGPLSGGEICYSVFKDGDDVEYSYLKDKMNPPQESYAKLIIRWGRYSFAKTGYITLSSYFSKEWSPTACVYRTGITRHFLPAQINAATRPHIPANRDMIFSWLEEFIHRPEDIKGRDDVEFVAGKEGVKQVEAEISNYFADPSSPDVVSSDHLASRFDISYRLVFDVLDKLRDEQKVCKLPIPDRYYEAIGLFGSSKDWRPEDTVPEDGSVDVQIH